MRKQFLNTVRRAFSVGAVALILLNTNVNAQTPEKMSYQAVLRDGANDLIVNQNVGMRMSVLQGSINGASVYVETHSASTNAHGLVSLEIGTGAVVSGTFSEIDWGNGSFFLKAETDPTGGVNYTIEGTSQLLSVPYALHAKNGLPSSGTHGQILAFCNGEPTWTLNGECPPPSGSFAQDYVHCNPNNPTQVIDVVNPVTGVIWMDRNLGANRVAISSTDAEAYGSLFQWGRFADGHQCVHRYAGDGVTTSSNTALNATVDSDTPPHGNFIITDSGNYDWRSPQNNNLWQGVSGTNNPCPSGYRIPTEAELNAERLSWSSDNSAGAFASPLKLSLAGGRDFYSGQLVDVGFGYLWSSTVSGSNARFLDFDTAYIGTYYRAFGFSVRCVKH